MRSALREHGPSLTVTALSSAFGVTLVQATAVMAAIIAESDIHNTYDTARYSLLVVSSVFIVIAVYVGSIVTANTFATVIAGRTRTIALMRLLGSSSAAQRRAVAREGLAVGAAGAGVGAVLALALTVLGTRIAVDTEVLPAVGQVAIDPLSVLPALMVVVTTWLASWVGSRRVLVVTPLQAIGAAVEATQDDVARRPFRTAIAGILVVGGTALLVVGVVLGLTSPYGFVVAFAGGLASFSGIILAAPHVVPPLLRLTGRALGGDAAARIAAENGVRHPERSARSTIGLVIAVTLITTFAVAAEGYSRMIAAAQIVNPETYQGVDEIVALTVTVFSALVGFSAIIAAIGMINNLTLSVVQRIRELGLLRALGFTAGDVRRMIVAESVQLTVTGIGAGLVLGIAYGWAGAQSLLGGIPESPGLLWPSVPWTLVILLVVAAVLITLIAAQIPARRAVRVPPMAALSAE